MCYGSLDPKYQMREIEARVNHVVADQRQLIPLLPFGRIAKWRPILHVRARFAATLLALTGCVETMPMGAGASGSAPLVEARTEHFSQQLRNDFLNYSLASWLARNCRGALGTSGWIVEQSLAARAVAEAETKGVYLGSYFGLTDIVSMDEVSQAEVSLTAKHDIYYSERLDWCKAGRAEQAEKTSIGRYLGG